MKRYNISKAKHFSKTSKLYKKSSMVQSLPTILTPIPMWIPTDTDIDSDSNPDPDPDLDTEDHQRKGLKNDPWNDPDNRADTQNISDIEHVYT